MDTDRWPHNEPLPQRRIRRDSGPHQGKVYVHITQFHQQSLVGVDDIVDSLDKVPNRHLEGLAEILYDPERRFQKNLFGWIPRRKRRIQAEYSEELRTLLIYPFDDLSVFWHALFHELGHYVFRHRIGGVVRKQWVTSVFNRREAVTPYGATNAAEGFAETYALYVAERQQLENTFPREHAFMRDLVFLGHGDAIASLDIRA